MFDQASLIVLATAACFAEAHTTTKTLTPAENPLTILFFMFLVQLPIGLVLTISSRQNPNINQWLWIIVIGLTALTAQYCMTKAMQHSEVTTIVMLDYLRLCLITVVGLGFYHERFDFALLAGGLFILFGNLINTYKPSVSTAFSNNKQTCFDKLFSGLYLTDVSRGTQL